MLLIINNLYHFHKVIDMRYKLVITCAMNDWEGLHARQVVDWRGSAQIVDGRNLMTQECLVVTQVRTV